MEPKITVGMEFGTYSKTLENLRERFVQVANKNNNNDKLIISKESYKFYKSLGVDKNGQIFLDNEVSASASKKVSIYLKDDNTYEKHYVLDAHFDGFTYSNRGNTKNDDDKFTFINTDTQTAFDRNGNGIVDEGEIYDKK